MNATNVRGELRKEFATKRALLGCDTRENYGTAGPLSVERLRIDLPFVNVSCGQTSTQRSAGPLLMDSSTNLIRAIHQLLLRKRDKLAGRDGPDSLHRRHCRERPARTALALHRPDRQHASCWGVVWLW